MTTVAAPRGGALSTSAPSRLARVVVIGSTAAVFGPYITGSVRTEQVVLYGLLVLLFAVVLTQIRPSGGGLKFLIPWSLYALASLASVFFPSTMPAPHGPGVLLAGLDNILAPLAVMLLVWSIVPANQALDLLSEVAKIVAAVMALNGALAIFGTRVDLTVVLRPFWGAMSDTTSVAAKAADLGRLGGIFNQPVEAGAMYSIAGLLAVLVWSKRPALLTMLLSLIVVGGLLSVSKVFILVGMPLILFYWFHTKRGGKKIALLLIGVFVVLGVVQSGILSQWTGYSYLARLIDPQGSAVSFYTAGRLGSDSAMLQTVADALNFSPLAGVGAGGWAVAYDSALTETIVVAGLLGLVCYLAILISLFVLARSLRGNPRIFAFLFAILIVGSSAGFTPLTANRVATISWILLALLVLAAKDSRKAQSDRKPQECAPGQPSAVS